MCGIFGVIGLDPNFCMQKMLSALHHRGPDDQNTYCNDHVSFGHTRLAIISKSEGAQPIFDDHENVLVFNGELYNFKELGQKHFNRDFSSDSQLLFELLKRDGKVCLNELRGMFSFAFYNSKTSITLLARDPFGMKPLFYAKKSSCTYFCSEFLALQNYLQPRLSKDSFYDYLQLGTTIADETLDQQIQQVLPGQILEVTGTNVVTSFYFTLDELLERGDPKSFESCFSQSCNRHMVSDVDVGLMLSGGMDSSAIAIQLKKLDYKDVDCYSFGFKDKEFDESGQAKALADHLGFQHTTIEFPTSNFIDSLQKALDCLDGPFGDASFIPTYFLTKEISKYKKVVLSGDGGDEVFFGYPTFMASRIQDLLPNVIQKVLAKLFYDLEVDSYTRVNFKEKLQRFAWGLSKGSMSRFLAYMSSISPKEFEVAFDNTSKKLDLKLSIKESYCSSIFVYYFRHYLSSQLLIKTDRASMKNSLEVRCPFLDVDFVQSVFSIPDKGFPIFQNSKQPVRNFLIKNLPSQLQNFQKKGFSAPLYKILPSLKALVERKHGLNLNCTRQKLFRYRFFSYNLLVYLYFYPSDEAQKVFKEFIAL